MNILELQVEMVRTRKRRHEASSSANADEPVPQQGPAHPVTVQQTDGHAHPVILPAPVGPAQRVEGVQPTSSASSMEPAQKGISFSENFTDVLPQSVPSVQSALGCHLTQAQKERIKVGNYIDLAMLLDVPLTASSDKKIFTLNESGELTLQTNQKQKIDTISKWTDAFIIYMSIYLESHPEKAQDLLKYMQSVRLGASRHSTGWLQYDQQFRLRMMAEPSKSWAAVDFELWLLYMGPLHQPAPFAPVYNKASLKKCYDFNYTKCLRPACQYKHSCIYCNFDHPCRSCQFRSRTAHRGGSLRSPATQPSFRPRGPNPSLRGHANTINRWPSY